MTSQISPPYWRKDWGSVLPVRSIKTIQLNRYSVSSQCFRQYLESASHIVCSSQSEPLSVHHIPHAVSDFHNLIHTVVNNLIHPLSGMVPSIFIWPIPAYLQLSGYTYLSLGGFICPSEIRLFPAMCRQIHIIIFFLIENTYPSSLSVLVLSNVSQQTRSPWG